VEIRKVVVVDDDEDYLDYLCESIEKRHKKIRVTKFKDYEELLKKLPEAELYIFDRTIKHSYNLFDALELNSPYFKNKRIVMCTSYIYDPLEIALLKEKYGIMLVVKKHEFAYEFDRLIEILKL